MSPDASRWYWNPESVVAVQQLFGPGWETPFRILTLLADSSVVLILVAVLFWTRGRRLAYTVLAAAMLGAMVSSILKVGIDVPRPEHVDLINYETRISPSFPSGHAMHAVAFWGSLVYFGLIRWPVAVAILVVVSVSRLYLGIHYPADLIGGALIGLAGIQIGRLVHQHVYRRLPDRTLSTLIAICFLGSVVMVPIAGEFPLGWEILGGLLGAGIGTLVECHWINYRPGQVDARRALLRVAIGAGGLLLVLGVGVVLREMTDSVPLRVLLVMPVGLWAMLGAPWVLYRLGYSDRTSATVGEPGAALRS